MHYGERVVKKLLISVAKKEIFYKEPNNKKRTSKKVTVNKIKFSSNEKSM
jgi:hypothetical protein